MLFYVTVIFLCSIFAYALAPIMSKMFALYVSYYVHVDTQNLDKLNCHVET